MADWLTRGLNVLANAVQYALEKLEHRKAQKASQYFAQAPVANRWYNAWREQKGLEPLDDAPASTDRQLSDQELDTLLASFYGAKALRQPPAESTKDKPLTAAQTAKQRLMASKTLTDAEQFDVVKADLVRSQQLSYISRVAEVVKSSELVLPQTQAHNQPKLQTKAAQQGINRSLQMETGITAQISPLSLPLKVDQTSNASKSFATSQPTEALLDMQPNPLAHMVARNQFLSDRLNRLANQYFEEKALEEATAAAEQPFA